MFSAMINWRKDEEGGTLVFVGVCLTVLLGFAALTFDLGRVAATQSDLQGFADHVALAAAGELDGKDDAISRATNAAEELIQDRQTFADGGQELGGSADYSLRFLSGLPNADRAYFDPNDDLPTFVTTDSTEATLVEVTTVPRTVFLPFFRAFAVLLGSDPSDAQVGARAVAGFTQYACDVTTLMFCLPDDNYDADTHAGDTILLRSGGGSGAWGPGDFGFVDPNTFALDPNGPCSKPIQLTGVKLDACLIAASGNRTRCFAQRGLDLEPGQKVGIENSIFNTRFDMFNGIMSNLKTNPHYSPGPHVVSGLTSTGGGQCLKNNPEPSTDTMAFPPDDCFGPPNTCDDGEEGRFGNGDWDDGLIAYVNKNYGTPPDTVGTIDPFGAPGITRFEYYKAEVNAAGASSDILTGRSETGRAQCASDSIDNVNRRVFIAAGIDCADAGIQGAATNVPVKEYFEVFLIRPVGAGTGSPAKFDLFVEIIGSAGGGGAGSAEDSGMFRDVVELYR
jgi:Flp pilus assembly protein TadG